MTLVLVKAGFWLAIILVVLYWALKVAAREDPTQPPPRSRRFRRSLTAVAGVLTVALLVEMMSFRPLYGGFFFGYLLGEPMASSTMPHIEAELGRLRSAVELYYADHEGRYPESVDELIRDKKYLDRPVGHADVFILGSNGSYARAHWHYQTNTLKNFSSREGADDSGGWGYVNDRSSPEWGTVFVNCTHPHWKRSRLTGDTDIPWNLLPEPKASSNG
ncbi:MAG: hypothetical protein HYZ74_00770 [Elusimicrobia bacterium]|nr:hypothetical protein [Elusimicrobiota bacterium]